MIKPTTRRIISNKQNSLSTFNSSTTTSTTTKSNVASTPYIKNNNKPSEKVKKTTPPPTRTRKYDGFALLPFDCIEIILDYLGIIEIEPKISTIEIWNDSFMNWTRFSKKWFGRCYLDGRVRFIFKFGIVKDCKMKYNLEHVKILYGISKRLNPSMISYWETQVIQQIIRINTKLLTKDNLSYMIQLEKRTSLLWKRKVNVSLFNSIKYVNLENIPKELKVLPILLRLFTNMEHLVLRDDFEWQNYHPTIFKHVLTPIGFISETCKKLEIIDSNTRKFYCYWNFRILKWFPNLEYLETGRSLLIKELEELISLKNLRVLILSGNQPSIQVYSIISQFPKFEKLTLLQSCLD